MTQAQLPIGMVMIKGCRCRCGHEWRPRDISQRPVVCPECKAATWDKPKRITSDKPQKGKNHA